MYPYRYIYIYIYIYVCVCVYMYMICCSAVCENCDEGSFWHLVKRKIIPVSIWVFFTNQQIIMYTILPHCIILASPLPLCIFIVLPPVVLLIWAMVMCLTSSYFTNVLNTLRTGLLNCLNARSRGLTFRQRASCI